MNALPLAKREEIARRSRDGESIRMIEEALGVSRETVVRYRGGGRRKHLETLFQAVFQWMEDRGVAWDECDPLMELFSDSLFTCCMHPDAKLDDVDPEHGCRLCRSEAMARSHSRRKSDGGDHHETLAGKHWTEQGMARRYTLTLACGNPKCPSLVVRSGKDAARLLRDVRGEGWAVGTSRGELCPKCRKEARADKCGEGK